MTMTTNSILENIFSVNGRGGGWMVYLFFCFCNLRTDILDKIIACNIFFSLPDSEFQQQRYIFPLTVASSDKLLFCDWGMNQQHNILTQLMDNYCMTISYTRISSINIFVCRSLEFSTRRIHTSFILPLCIDWLKLICLYFVLLFKLLSILLQCA